MKTSDMVKATVESGITPIVLDFDKVVFFEEERPVCRTLLRINSLELGTLTYSQYRFVARRTKQGNHLVRRHLEKLFRIIPQLMEKGVANVFTVPVYARLLAGGELAAMLIDAFSLFPEVTPSSICIELSADVLYEDLAAAREGMEQLRGLGVKIAICEVGDEFCPVFRLAELPFDYAFIDSFATASLSREDSERVAGSLVQYLHYLKAKVIAPSLKKQAEIDEAARVGLDGYTVEVDPFEQEVADGEEV